MSKSKFCIGLIAMALLNVSAEAAESTSRYNSPKKPMNIKSTLPVRSSLGQAKYANKSVLEDAPAASPKLTSIIRSREGNLGAGLVGGALLLALLQEESLSINDRSWIESRLNRMKQNGEFEEGLVPPVFSPVLFEFSGLEQSYNVKTPISIKVSALSNGKPVYVNCTLLGAKVNKSGKTVSVNLVASEPMTQLLTCYADAHIQRRIISVIEKK